MSLPKRLGIILLIFTIAGTYYFITRQLNGRSAPATLPVPVTFFCSNNGSMQAVFATGSVALTLSDGRSLSLPQMMSGSGARYEATTTGVDIFFWNKGDNAFISENEATTYVDCTAAHVVSSDVSGYDVYSDQSKSFSFTFPTDFSIAGSAVGYTQDWSVNATTSGMVLAHIEVPKSFEAGTNFGDARFTVGTSADPSAIAECLTSPKGNYGSTTPVTMNGVPFTKITFTGAGAGNRYDTTSYRAVRGNQCYAVEYTIHYGVIENYPVGTVKEFDEARVQSALEKMVQSFQFLP